MKNGLILALMAILPIAALAQQPEVPRTPNGVTADDLLARPVGTNWTSYNGDYTGQRYSSLKEINVANVSQLQAAWVFIRGTASDSK